MTADISSIIDSTCYHKSCWFCGILSSSPGVQRDDVLQRERRRVDGNDGSHEAKRVVCPENQGGEAGFMLEVREIKKTDSTHVQTPYPILGFV